MTLKEDVKKWIEFRGEYKPSKQQIKLEKQSLKNSYRTFVRTKGAYGDSPLPGGTRKAVFIKSYTRRIKVK